MVSAYTSGGLEAVQSLVQFDHHRKRPVSSGRIARPDEVRKVREGVLPDVLPWLERGYVGSSEDKAAFDNALGAALHRELSIVPSDAAHEETWSFLTIIVFPDLAAVRFSSLHRDRLIGTGRNTLRRSWQRQEVLGSLLQQGDPRMREDELVGLFERTAMVRNRPLARQAVSAVLERPGRGRTEWAREFYKAVAFQTGARLLDVLDDAAIQDVIRQAVDAASRPVERPSS
ncbi:hypothetical protein [Nocardioides taihuensis]|uniref:Uncharacterized protein n=1 Tax=Nocardioides taihuensis TaxID=1835606 RepID=A0ABW0BMG1_9ACTN